MKKIFVLTVLLLIVSACTVSASDYIVELTKPVNEIEEYETEDFRDFGFGDCCLYVTDNLELIEKLDEMGLVVCYEEDAVMTLIEPVSGENEFIMLSALDEDAFDITKVKRDEISNTFAAKEYPKGENTIRVAVIDSGVGIYDANSDIRAEFTNVVDGKSYVDSYPFKDDTNHGTPAAGLIGGQLSGIAPNCEIISLKAFGSTTGSVTDVANAVRVAVDTYGCKVINISATVKSNVAALKTAVKYAVDKGVIIVASTGNYGQDGSPLCYPAAYDGVIGVGAVNQQNEWASFSCANEANDICALGYSVYTPFSYSSKSKYYGYVSGTSFSCPQVAGLAALLCSYKPDMTPDDFLKILEATSYDPGDSGYDITFGHGVIDVKEALDFTIKNPKVYSSRIFESDGNLNYKIYNYSPVSRTFTVIKAIYDSSDRMLSCEPVEVTVASKEVKPISDAVTYDSEKDEYFRLMVWKSLDKMTPMCKTREYN